MSNLGEHDDGTGDFQAQADAAIRDYCGWHIAPTTTETLTLDGSGTPVLLLPSLHVVAVISVVELGVALLEGDGRGYDWSAAGMLIKPSRSPWTARPRGVVVEVTHGYEAVPPDLVGVATDLAGRLQLGAAGGVVTSGGFALSGLNQGLDAIFTAGSYEATVLDHYRIANLR